MRKILFLLAGASCIGSQPAYAAEVLKFGPAANWVVPHPVPLASTVAKDAPLAILLSDQQVRFDPGKVSEYIEIALKLQSAEGLNASNIAFPWQPSTDTVTVHKVQLIRGGRTIDVLGSGQTFTIARRETNLDAATLDGTLTAMLQPEGVQIGDILSVAYTTERVDPVMKGHVEADFAMWNSLPIERARSRLSWPTTINLTTRQSVGLPQTKAVAATGNMRLLEVAGPAVEPLVLPKSAPPRFSIGRRGEATDFRSWADVAGLISPLFKSAAVIPATGPLRNEVESIRKLGLPPIAMAERALQLVQGKVRYVALLMGTGGYVPASAETTWSRRYGDCKAKTALLVAILQDLGIAAEPVLVNSSYGDALPERLPMVGLFDHVIARASIGGQTYWLDGTRNGDTSLAQLTGANFRWGLPLVNGPALVPIAPQQLSLPSNESTLVIDASAGLLAPAPTTAELVYRGESAKGLKVLLANLPAAQKKEMLRTSWKEDFDFLDPGETSVAFDEARAELRLSTSGTSKIEFDDGQFELPGTSIGYEAEFERAPGPFRDAPISVGHPWWSRSVFTIKLPRSLVAAAPKGVTPPVEETLAGVQYKRTQSFDGNTMTVQTTKRSVASEIPYKDARAAETRLKALYDQALYLQRPRTSTLTEDDWSTIEKSKPITSDQYHLRAGTLADAGKIDEAFADLKEAIRLDPRNINALATRSLLYSEIGRSADAEKDIAAIEAIGAPRAGMLAFKASQASNAGKFNDVVAYTTELLKTAPNHPVALTRRANAYYAMQKYDKALADTALALENYGDASDLHLLRANILMQKGDLTAAAREAEALAKIEDDGVGLIAAGKVYAKIKNKPKSMEMFDRALRLKPSAMVYLNRAQARSIDDVAAKKADIAKAAELEPDNAALMESAASTLQRLGDNAGALALVDRAIAAGADNPHIRIERAVALYKVGRVAEANEIFAAQKRMSQTVSQLNSLCWTKAAAGILLESAVEDCKAGLKLMPDRKALHDSLGLALFRLGRFDQAIDSYDEALARSKGATSLMGRALARKAKGDEAGAREDLAAARKLDVDIEDDFAGYGLKL
ncbi:DUF3857 domain-containing protein [Sphingomonas sinipercae]|uniref:DUF3857 domain-containing protein n=1 Tax=Sphingomonas sinipercae TaxID=2714944 RepID=A0A6G7ZNQ1_9SPHN|nr:DUF3857 domain-containing protein [Sphingomonas sinipercae]QIL02563.1 DUF3857 domain-containing protein [Sphingomonas sinipercae]